MVCFFNGTGTKAVGAGWSKESPYEGSVNSSSNGAVIAPDYTKSPGLNGTGDIVGINRLFKPMPSFRFGSHSDYSCKGHTAVIFNHRQQLTVSPVCFLSSVNKPTAPAEEGISCDLGARLFA